MYWKISFFVILIWMAFPSIVLARVTRDDIYQEKRAVFKTSLEKIKNPTDRQKIELVDQKLNGVNQKVCDRFDIEIKKLSAILEEEKERQNVTDAVVAYGRGDTPIDTAAYYLNYAAEAVAYQRSQDYTPVIGSNYKVGLTSSLSNLKSNLNITQSKIIKAKTEVKKAVDHYEKRSL